MNETTTPVFANDDIFLITGKSRTGKSSSLQHIENPKGVMYLNCDSSGKKLPFKQNKDERFRDLIVTDPSQVYTAFEEAEEMKDIHTIVIDTLTYLMEMYESIYVIDSPNGMEAWSNFAQYFKKLINQYAAASSKNIIFLAHTFDQHNEIEMLIETSVPIKGSLKKNGIESYFSSVISTKKKSLKDLEPYESDFLTINEEEKLLGYKHVFQTRVTKDSINERISSPIGMWPIAETFINNDVQIVLNRLKEFYGK